MSTTAGTFIAGGIAACGAVTATHPFETLKIRMQLQGELQHSASQPRLYHGPIHGIRTILSNEGLIGVYRGLPTAYTYQIIMNGCRLGFYEPIRRTLNSAFLSLPPTAQSLPINSLSGALTGILGAAAGSPFFLVKTRLQSFSPAAPVGTQHAYRGAIDGLRSIYQKEGVRGWYRGAGASMVRTGFGSSVQLPVYFLAKRVLVGKFGASDNVPLHLLCGGISGFVVCCVMHPPDTIMSRLYNQNGNLYRGVLDCVAKTVQTEGVFALYKGFVPHLARILPHTVLTLALSEQTIKMVRVVEKKLGLGLGIETQTLKGEESVEVSND